MAYKNITRVNLDPLRPNTGAVYHETIVMTAGTYSDNYIFPPNALDSISFSLDGDGSIQVTNDPESVIQTGSPTWATWDARSQISNAVTGFRVVRNSGTVTAKITVRSRN